MKAVLCILAAFGVVFLLACAFEVREMIRERRREKLRS